MRLQIIRYTMSFKVTWLGQALKYALKYVLFNEPSSSYSNIALFVSGMIESVSKFLLNETISNRA